MDNWPVWGNLVLAYGITTIIFQLIYFLDKRVKNEGTLFTQVPSKKSRVYALLIGILFLGFSFLIWLVNNQINFLMVILVIAAIGLLGYAAGIISPLYGIQEGYAEKFGMRFVKRRPIIGIKGLSVEEVFKQVQAGARFIVFDYCISPLVVVLDYNSDIFFIKSKEEARKRGQKYTLISLLCGWFCIFGPINTVHCISSNLQGGKDVTNLVLALLRQSYAPRTTDLQKSSSSEVKELEAPRNN